VAQKVDFDRPVWWEWMFHIYLSTIVALLRTTDRPDGTLEPDVLVDDLDWSDEAPF